MLSFFRGETIIIVRKAYSAVNDKWGNPISEESVIEIEAIVAFQNTSRNVTVEGSINNTSLKLIFDEGTIIEDGDIFVIRGTDWEQDGINWTPDTNMFVNNPNFIEATVIVNIKQVKGNV